MTRLQQTIYAILKGVAQDHGDMRVMLETRPMANVRTSEVATPCAVCFCISDWRFNIRDSRRRESADVLVSFLDRQPNYGFDGIPNSAIVAPMEDAAEVFVARVLATPTLEVEGNEISARTVYDEYDTNLTGVQLTLRVGERQGTCLATDFPEPEPTPEPEPEPTPEEP